MSSFVLLLLQEAAQDLVTEEAKLTIQKWHHHLLLQDKPLLDTLLAFPALMVGLALDKDTSRGQAAIPPAWIGIGVLSQLAIQLPSPAARAQCTQVPAQGPPAFSKSCIGDFLRKRPNGNIKILIITVHE